MTALRRVRRIDAGPGIGSERALNRVAHAGVEPCGYSMFAHALR